MAAEAVFYKPYDEEGGRPFPPQEYIESLYHLFLLSAVPGHFLPFEVLSEGNEEMQKRRQELISLWSQQDISYENKLKAWTAASKPLEWEAVRHVANNHRDFIKQVNGDAKNKPVVVFLLSRVSYKVFRYAIALRKRGIGCYLISLSPIHADVRRFAEDSFDSIAEVKKNYLLLGSLIKILEPHIFHISCSMWEYASARVVNENKGRAACITELDDLSTSFAPRGILHRYWAPDMVDLDFVMEGYLCNRCDGFLYQWDDQLVERLKERHGGIGQHMGMQPYPVTELCCHNFEKPSKSDGIIRLVWAGAVLPDTDGVPAEVFCSKSMPSSWKIMLESGLGVEVYADPSKDFDLEGEFFQHYQALREVSPHFILQTGEPPDRVSNLIRHCDFGIILSDLEETGWGVRPEKLAWDLPNKLWAYMEAGLPMIVNSEYTSLAQRIEEWGIGFGVHSKEVHTISDKIKTFDYEKSVNTIQKIIKTKNMDLMIGDLMDFYKRLNPKFQFI